MNEVWLPAMYAVVVAIVAECDAITQVVAQVGPLPYLNDMVSFQVAVGSTFLALVAIALEYGGFPSQIFGAAPALVLPVALALGYALTRYTTIGFVVRFIGTAVNRVGVGAAKLFAANGANASRGIGEGATPAGAVHLAANVGGCPLQFLAAIFAGDRHLLGLSRRIAGAATKTFLGILVPVPVSLFRNWLTANLAKLQLVHHATIIAKV